MPEFSRRRDDCPNQRGVRIGPRRGTASPDGLPGRPAADQRCSREGFRLRNEVGANDPFRRELQSRHGIERCSGQDWPDGLSFPLLIF